MNYRRLIPILLIALLWLIAYGSGLTDYLSFETLKKNRRWLLKLVTEAPIRTALAFMIIYTIAVALSFPGAAFLTVFGGFLFPQPWVTLYVVVSATLGATILFAAAKTALREVLREKAGRLLNKMKAGFQENAVTYLLFLRLVPVFPFWLVNLAPAFFGVHLPTFIWTTFVGIIPGSFAYSQAGRGLGAIFDSGDSFSFSGLLNPEMKIALAALAVVAFIPLVLKRLKKTTNAND